MENIELQKDKAMSKAKESHSLELKEVEVNRMLKKYDIKMQQEKEKVSIMHNLEVQRLKMECEGRFNTMKQRVLLSADPKNDRDSALLEGECERLKMEIDDIREKKEHEMDAHRGRLE